MAMNYLRELLYRPKRSDKSLMARFYFADLNLNAVAQELDSFDGRKDPERCTCLVNKLRSCQDKLLSICNKMLEKVEPGLVARSREFRAKFPDDIMTDNLAGQLWFGAECLAAGSSIMHKERESDSMRPLAKAVTKSLEKVRGLLREQCLSPQPEYTESIRENIKIFDRLFAEFEFAYVQCMVHVKSVREYELQQDLVVLFSDTLQRALANEMITQDMIDLYEPSLMFAIPRLAIVYGLLICPEGPLNVDRGSRDFPDLFLPFKNLLKKIKELLLTLAPHEVVVLEMLLCQHEEPANITVKLKEVERMLENKVKTEEGRAQVDKLLEKLTTVDKTEDKKDEEGAEAAAEAQREKERRRRHRRRHRESKEVASSLVRELADLAVEVGEARREQRRHHSEPPLPSGPPPARVSRRRRDIVEIDCTDPEIRVSSSNSTGNSSSNRRPPTRFGSVPSSMHHHVSSSSSSSSPPHSSSAAPRRHVRVEVAVVGAESVQGASPPPSSLASPPSSAPGSAPDLARSQSSPNQSAGGLADCSSGGSPLESSYSPRPRQRLKRHNAKRDSRRIPMRYQKDRRAKFKSTEDLLHRLYVCISGAADQLQSNYAGDFRSILKNVFVMNTSQDEEEDEDEDLAAVSVEGAGSGHLLSPSSDTAPEEPLQSPTEAVPAGARRQSGGGTSSSSLPTSQSLPNTFPRVDLGTDALQEEMSQQLVNEFLPASTSSDELDVPLGAEGAVGGGGQGLTYAQNLDLHLQQEREVETPDSSVVARRGSSTVSAGGDGSGGGGGGSDAGDGSPPSPVASFFQPEPTLLDIASGSRSGSIIDDGDLPPEARGSESFFEERPVRAPPPWIPDSDAPNCMGCSDPFTMFRRRHHCRNCGKVFCGRCSGHSIPLPQFNMHRPVRVCNRCNVLCQFAVVTSPADADLGSPGGGGPGGPGGGHDEDEDLDEDASGHHSPGDPHQIARSPWGGHNLGMIS